MLKLRGSENWSLIKGRRDSIRLKGILPAHCQGRQKFLFLGSCGWTNNKMNIRQINRRKRDGF